MSQKITGVEFTLLTENARVPEYAHDGDAGADLFAAEYGRIYPGERATVGTGVAIALAPGFMAEIRSRSGLAAKSGIQVLNSPGTIDSGYRGELKVILHNTDNYDSFAFGVGDRIAQLVCTRFVVMEFLEVEEFSENSERGTGGFGSTGL